MSDDDRISKPAASYLSMTNDIDITQMYQQTIKPLKLSEEQKESLSEQQYQELAVSESSRFGDTDAFIIDSTPIQFDGPLASDGFVRGILLLINDGTISDLVFCTVDMALRYPEKDSTNFIHAFLASSVVLTPNTTTLQGDPLSYFSNTDDKVLEIAFQLDCALDTDTSTVSVVSLAYFHGQRPKIPTTVSIIAVDLCMFKKQENIMTENQDIHSDKLHVPSDDRVDVTSGPAEEVATLYGHLQLRPDDITFVNDGVNSATATFTVPDDMTNHFRLKPTITELRFEKMYPDVKIPQKQTSGSAGMDVHAYLPESVVIPPGERRLIPTGLKTCFPDWMELQVRSRSGLALKHGIIVLNAPGTIDADYPGELGVILYNTSMTPYLVQHDARIAQLVPAQVLHIPVVEGVREEETSRTSSGFGSTGV